MEGTIYVITRDDQDLTKAESAVVVEALRHYWEILANTPQGDKAKAYLLISAAEKLGFYKLDEG